MSIETVGYNGPAVLTCDKCSTFIEFSSFKKAVAFKKKQKEKENGWRSYMEKGIFRDACSACCQAYVKGGS